MNFIKKFMLFVNYKAAYYLVDIKKTIKRNFLIEKFKRPYLNNKCVHVNVRMALNAKLVWMS